MRNRFLTVPKNQRGVEEYDYGVEHTSNLVEAFLPEEEFEELYKKGVFREINNRCSAMIDDYESAEISANDLEKCMDIIQTVPGVFSEMAKEAEKYGTFLYLDF